MGISPSVDFPAVKWHPVKKILYCVSRLTAEMVKKGFWLLDVFVVQIFKASEQINKGFVACSRVIH